MEVVIRYDSGEDYSVNGYMLTRIPNPSETTFLNGFDPSETTFLYAFEKISHCSCYSTEYPKEEDYTLTYEDVIRFAKNKSDPRVPDTVTDDKYLLKIYEIILKNMIDNPEWISDVVYQDYIYREVEAKVTLINMDDDTVENITD